MISRRSILAAFGLGAGAAAAVVVDKALPAVTTELPKVFSKSPAGHVGMYYGVPIHEVELLSPQKLINFRRQIMLEYVEGNQFNPYIDKWTRDDIELLGARGDGSEELELEGIITHKRHDP